MGRCGVAGIVELIEAQSLIGEGIKIGCADFRAVTTEV